MAFEPERGWRERLEIWFAYIAKHPEAAPRHMQAAAAYKVYNAALRRGELVRASHCSRCGAVDARKPEVKPSKIHRRIEGHHPDYLKPLEVVWLCSVCHSTVTAREREARKQVQPVRARRHVR